MINRRKSAFFGAAAIFWVVVLGMSFPLVWTTSDRDPDVPTTLESRVVRVGDTDFQAEIAKTDATREPGLGGRDGLCGGCGMLFVFDRPDRYRFWMKGMRFDLDFVWIADGAVVDVTENVPYSETGTFTSSIPADRVLEIAAGEVERHGIRIGDRVDVR